jgi:hypothetical protein
MHPANLGPLLTVCGALCVAGCKPAPDPAQNADPSSSARYACKDFLARSGYHADDWGQWSAWTTLQNQDGTWSVGARFMGAAPGSVTRNLYVTCVMKNSGDNWQLQSLSRLQ